LTDEWNRGQQTEKRRHIRRPSPYAWIDNFLTYKLNHLRNIVLAASIYPFYDVKMILHRLFLLLAAVPLLHACGSDRQEPLSRSETIDASPLSPDQEHCRAVARERADDALANGYGLEVEDSMYRETYDECISWRIRNKVK
jgi:hypothetical protein